MLKAQEEPARPKNQAAPHASVDRVLDVVETLASANKSGMTVSELCHRTGISRPSLYRILSSLEGREWATREDRAWNIGPGLAGTRDAALQSASIIERTRPALVRLWEEYGETVNLGVPSRDEVLYLDILESLRGLRTGSQVGSRDPMHATALGKVFLAARPSSEVRRIIGDSELSQLTAQTTTAIAPLMQELSRVNEQGWALDDEESVVGVRCIAAPLRDRDGRTIAAISLSAPKVRFDNEAVPIVADALMAEASGLVL